MRKVAIILPTYNEAKNISQLIEGLNIVIKTLPKWDIHIVVVDSSSPDNTADIVKKITEKNKHVHLLQTKKEGLGQAYINGFKYAIENLKPYLLFEMDADHSHDPKKIPAFLEQIENGSDFVIGSRYIKGGSIPKDWGIERKFFSVVGNWIIRLGFMNLKITDWTSGYRAIKTWIVEKSLTSVSDYTGYVFQVALLDNAVKMKAQISEVAINFVDRKEGVSKINSGQYTLHTLWYVFTHSSFIKFCIVGGIGFLVDFAFAYLFIHVLNISKVIANMMSAEVAIISNFLLNNSWSFAHKKIDNQVSAIYNFLKFNLVASGSIIIQGAGMWIALTLLGDSAIHIGSIEFHSWIIYKIFIIFFIIIPYSYIFYNKFIWKDNT